MERREHWEGVYRSKAPGERSWFQPRPAMSLALMKVAGCDPSTRIIDVGGGTSSLVDALVTEGYRNVSVLDVAPSAVSEVRARLGASAPEVRAIEGDVLSDAPGGPYDVWHDRAVFHFLTDAADRAAYIRTLERSLDPQGHAIIATFAEDGPTRCSGLPVVRYGPPALLEELGEGFELVETRRELHRTPQGREQPFTYCLFRRRSA